MSVVFSYAVWDLVTGKGRLLATKGTMLTSALIEKLLNLNRIDPINGPVHVLVKD